MAPSPLNDGTKVLGTACVDGKSPEVCLRECGANGRVAAWLESYLHNGDGGGDHVAGDVEGMARRDEEEEAEEEVAGPRKGKGKKGKKWTTWISNAGARGTASSSSSNNEDQSADGAVEAALVDGGDNGDHKMSDWGWKAAKDKEDRLAEMAGSYLFDGDGKGDHLMSDAEWKAAIEQELEGAEEDTTASEESKL